MREEIMRKKFQNSRKADVTIKSLALLIAAILLLSAAPVWAEESSEDYEIIKYVSFSEPEITETLDGFVDIVVDGASSKWTEQAAPILPKKTIVVTLPLDATSIEVTFAQSETQSMAIPEGKMVTPGPIAELLTLPGSSYKLPDTDPINNDIYNSDEPYGDRFSYSVNVGIMDGKRQIIVVGEILPCTFSSVVDGELSYITSGEMKVSYTRSSSTLPLDDEEEEKIDLLILTPRAYVRELQPLIAHKEDKDGANLRTKLVTLDEIYAGIYYETPEWIQDNQEQIKYFIYNAILNWDVTYVLAVGGYRTFFGLDVPSKQFPIRYSHLNDTAEPGYATDQYYSCCLKHDGDDILFDDWDSNGNGIFAEFTAKPDDWWEANLSKPLDLYDPFPDVYFGRLACRNRKEVKNMVEKIIYYETHTFGEDWFNRILTITGDGFQDIGMFDSNSNAFSWDVNSLPDGEYTIYAQSKVGGSLYGPIDEVKITIDSTAPSRVSFYEDDHLKVEPKTEEQERVYPGLPVAEIVVPQSKDVLGYTDVDYIPEEAYIGDNWARVQFVDGVIKIRVKSYDPSPQEFGDMCSKTKVFVWVNNSDGETVKGPLQKDQSVCYEGEKECQVGLNFMPDTFNKTKLWASNGEWAGMSDVIDAFSDGYGFVYFAGHGNPMSWGDHLPGIPGGRDDGMINGLKNINLDFGLARYESEQGDPLLPMDQLTNGYRLPITLVGGCHNSMIDASFMKLLADPHSVLFTVLHGAWVPECWSWWLTRMPQGGSIATIGCSGLGYGLLGSYCTLGVGGWMNPRFFYVYANENRDILGEVFTETLSDYAIEFGPVNTFLKDTTDRKTFEEWVLLGDPSLKIGGYPSVTGALDDDPQETNITIGEIELGPGTISTTLTNNGSVYEEVDWEIALTGDSPLGEYLGGTPLLIKLFKGRILRGAISIDTVALSPSESSEITSNPIFGLGHILMNITISVDDEAVIKISEDGFVLGNRIILYHGEE